MIEKLKELLALHSHLRDWPLLKNARAAVEAQIKEIEDKLGPSPQAPTPRAIPNPPPTVIEEPLAEDEPAIERRV